MREPWEAGLFRLAALCVSTLSLCAAASCIGVYGLDWYRVQKSKRLIERFQLFQVGQTTEREVKEVADHFGGEYFQPEEATQESLPQPAYYRTEISTPYVSIGNSNYTLPGLRLWFVVARLDVERGRLLGLSLSQFMFRSDSFALSTEVSLTKSGDNGLYDFGPYDVYEAFVSGSPPGEAFEVRLSPDATAEQRSKAFDFNFSCLTPLHECRHVCEMLPMAWRDLSPDKRLRYADRRELVSDSECRERMK